MKNVLLSSILLISAVSTAQTPDRAADLQKQLLDIEAKVAAANNACDYDFFRRVEAEEFIFTDSQGTVTTRAEDLAGEKDCKQKDYKSEFDEPRLLQYPGVAVLNARHTISGEKDGKAFRVQTRFTDIFVWRDGRWQMVLGHSSRIPAPKP